MRWLCPPTGFAARRNQMRRVNQQLPGNSDRAPACYERADPGILSDVHIPARHFLWSVVVDLLRADPLRPGDWCRIQFVRRRLAIGSAVDQSQVLSRASLTF